MRKINPDWVKAQYEVKFVDEPMVVDDAILRADQEETLRNRLAHLKRGGYPKLSRRQRHDMKNSLRAQLLALKLAQ